MAESTLINHCGGVDVSREDLALIEPPVPTSTWYPIAHRDVLSAVEQTLQAAHFEIRKSRLSISYRGARFFGTLYLATPISDGVNLCVGIRNSTDKSFPIGFACGTRVFVCDNLAFTSEVVVSKKHTRFGRERYREGIAHAVSGLHQYRDAAGDWINRLERWDLSDDVANSYLLQAYESDIIGARLLPLVIQEWRKPTFSEYEPRTAWSLFNCITAVLGRTRQSTHPAATALTTIRLQRLLQPTEDVIDSTVA